MANNIKENWEIAIGLQRVDGLSPSKYLRDIAAQNISGEINAFSAYKIIKSYYKEKEIKNIPEKEADLAASGINNVLSEKAFSFSVPGILSIHRKIFGDIFPHAGKIRPYNISKDEWVLNGESVIYAPFSEIEETLLYDLNKEKKFDYVKAAPKEKISHFAKFISGIWQIHPFCEGNTRTIAVFLIKYLQSLGFNVQNKPFAENSWYFRNALVRANYANIPEGIREDYTFLEKMLSNILFETEYELKNRDLYLPEKENESPR